MSTYSHKKWFLYQPQSLLLYRVRVLHFLFIINTSFAIAALLLLKWIDFTTTTVQYNCLHHHHNTTSHSGGERIVVIWWWEGRKRFNINPHPHKSWSPRSWTSTPIRATRDKRQLCRASYRQAKTTIPRFYGVQLHAMLKRPRWHVLCGT